MEDHATGKGATGPRPPIAPGPLAIWFAEAVNSEIAELEKHGKAQTYEVLSGRLIDSLAGGRSVVQFIIADGLRIPEDANGRLKTATGDYEATIIGQQSTQISLLLEGKAVPTEGIARAQLIIDDTALLRRLEDALVSAAKGPAQIGPLSTTIFHTDQATVGSVDLSGVQVLNSLSFEKRRVIEQACGSSLTYVWGPPGTGKTHVIAHLVGALIERGERTLVTSHTHAAVDQALKELVAGSLVSESTLAEGKILRLGQTPDPQIPDSVRFEKVVESKGRDLNSKMADLETRLGILMDRVAECRHRILQWDELAQASEQVQSEKARLDGATMDRKLAEDALGTARQLVANRQMQLEQAQRSWFRRNAKVQRATQEVGGAQAAVRRSEDELREAVQAINESEQDINRLSQAEEAQRINCETLPTRDVLEAEALRCEVEIQPVNEALRQLREELSQLEYEVLNHACTIFCTLTKNYMARELQNHQFDAVVADEVSMALPPLLFLAGARATKRVILVGDFLQLAPIIRSDVDISEQRLGQDVFHLAKVAIDNRPVKGCAVLCSLTTQRRMLPPIADVARRLVYSPAGLLLKDDDSVLHREVPSWVDFLPAHPLLIVDTADLHCWCGKQPNTLSRFNFYSATVAAELAGMAAARQSQPRSDMPQSIAIITPFAAQRRLIAHIIDGMGLERWVAVGTVHTFQGSQAHLVIFDSVLDEPYWSARLSNPKDATDVLRDINVAVTRAQSRFVFVGSSAWLNQHARPLSGLGKLWDVLKNMAPLESATELVEKAFEQRVAYVAEKIDGWRLPNPPDRADEVWQVLDEHSFFPQFFRDVESAKHSIFGLVPYFGEFRWPKVQPWITAALQRGVAVTFVTPPLDEVTNQTYVEKCVTNLRQLGAIVVPASGLHGKDIIIDESIYYTGSLNWASHRGNAEIMHRIVSPDHAKLVLQYLQARFIRAAAVDGDGHLRICPQCGGPIHIVNQRQQSGPWDGRQSLKIGCANYKTTGCKYLRDVDERPPFREPPKCSVDGKTKYRRVRRGNYEVWQCPKHPQKCPRKKVVLGDP
jgi:hypothetical protein